EPLNDSGYGLSLPGTLFRVSLPVFVATIVWLPTSPPFPSRRSSDLLVICRWGFCSAVTSAGAHCSGAPVAETHAVSASLPASRSARVILRVPAHDIDLPGASVGGIGVEQLKPSSAGSSSTDTLHSVT